MTDDQRLDERLARAGAAWRRTLPPPGHLQPTGREPRRARRRLLLPLAAAAAVALVVGTTLVVRSGAERSAAPIDHRRASSVVPWAPLPARHPRIPSRRIGPTRAELGAAPACGAADLRPGRRSVEGAGGTMYIDVPLRLVGSRSCRLDGGYPDATLLGPRGSLGLRIKRVSFDGEPARPVLVTRRAPAVVTLAWAVSHDCRNLDNTAIRWRIAGRITFSTRGFGTTTCNPDERASAPWAPPVQGGSHGHRVSPYEQVHATGDLTLTGRPGTTLDFTVTLTSDRDLLLTPCPDYTISVFTGRSGDGSTVRRGLNCAGVPHRAADGEPYLPAGVPVRFAMRVTAPNHNAPTFLWKLDVAPAHPALTGSITVQAGDLSSTLTGVVTMSGGPAPGVTTKVTTGTVTVTSGRHSTTTDIGPRGRYEVKVAPGRYAVTVRTKAWNGGAVYADGTIEAPPQATTTRNISLPMR